MVSVRYEKVTKRYDDGTEAVLDLDLEVSDGEFLVLLGPSGCGKSTTLRMLAGLEDISEGEIRIDGVRINDLPPGARGLGMVFQSYALYPHMNIEDNLSFGLKRMKGEDKLSQEEIDSRVQEMAQMLGLSEELAKRP
ncbi:MAG: ABC transporter ATP-binding protein, partial [Candidatus Poseidoniaceae archaeon]|nr:ABC transporter ATP-binding protein [Candidatus Poseidoniaceae archaeon]